MRRRLLIGSIAAATVIFWIGAAVALRASWGVIDEFAHAATLAEIGPHPQSTIVYDRQNRPAFTFYVEQRDRRAARSRLATHGRCAPLRGGPPLLPHHGIDRVRIAERRVAQLARRTDPRRRQHASRSSSRARAVDAAREPSSARFARRRIAHPPGAALLEGADPQRVPERGLLRRRLLRRRGRVARLLRQARGGSGRRTRRRCSRRWCARRAPIRRASRRTARWRGAISCCG